MENLSDGARAIRFGLPLEIGGSDKGEDYHHHHHHRDRGGVASSMTTTATGNHHSSRMIDDDEEYSMEASRTLWVGNLERRFTPGDVKKLFNQHCRVLVRRNRNRGAHSIACRKRKDFLCLEPF